MRRVRLHPAGGGPATWATVYDHADLDAAYQRGRNERPVIDPRSYGANVRAVATALTRRATPEPDDVIAARRKELLTW